MMKHQMTEQRDTNAKQHETPRSRSGRARLVRFGLLVFVLTFTLGNRNCEEQRAATISCMNASIRVESGTCAQFLNPCQINGGDPGQWLPPGIPEGFRLEITDEARDVLEDTRVWLESERVGDETVRSICVSPNSPPIANVELPFTYAQRSNYGTASIILTVAPPLVVEATASPTTLSVGDRSQLVAHVSGGVPPYFYSWIPQSTLNDNDIAAPTADPHFTTTYTVGVTDSSGLQATGQVTARATIWKSS